MRPRVVALAAAGISASLAAGPSISVVDVFSKGEAGYFCTKIPDLVALHNGSLLAFGEARVGSCSDYAPTDLVMKRSDDGGQSWSGLRVVHAERPSVVGNAAPVQLPADHPAFPGRVLIPFCVNNSRVMLRVSDDGGSTWSSARDLTPAATLPGWGWVGLGPPAGLVLSGRSPAPGRVVVPAYHSPYHSLDGTFTHPHLLLSDDGGRSWRLGAIASNETDPFFSNECQAAELPGGRLLVAARTLALCRSQGLSPDGGETLGPMRAVPELPQPLDGVEGSLLALASGRLLLTSLDEASVFGSRTNLTLHASDDSGGTWRPLRVLDAGFSAYSALALLGNGSVAVLFERAATSGLVFVPDHISFGIALE